MTRDGQTKLSQWAAPLAGDSDVLAPPPLPPESLLHFSVPAAWRWWLLYGDPLAEPHREEARQAIRDLVGDAIHYRHAPQFSAEQCAAGIAPYIWYRQSGTLRERCLDSYDPLPHVVTLDVEVWSCQAEEAEFIEHQLAILNEGYTGEVGAITVQDMLVENQDDNYVPQGIGGDYGLHAQAFQLEIYPNWED